MKHRKGYLYVLCIFFFFSQFAQSERVDNKAKVTGLIAEQNWEPDRGNDDGQLKITPNLSSSTPWYPLTRICGQEVSWYKYWGSSAQLAPY